jgi:hypothetical protein
LTFLRVPPPIRRRSGGGYIKIFLTKRGKRGKIKGLFLIKKLWQIKI